MRYLAADTSYASRTVRSRGFQGRGHMRALTGAVIGSAVTAVVLGGFALARYEASAGAQDAACSTSFGYVRWITFYVQSDNAFQASITAQDAYNAAKDAGAPGLAADLRTLAHDGDAWTDARTAAVRANVVSDLKQVYNDCGQTYTGS